jgi:hypothetical protein
VIDDQTIVAALRACQETRETIKRDLAYWFPAQCVFDQLAAAVEKDRRAFVDIRAPLGEWIDRHGRFADEPGVRHELEGPLPTVRYIVLPETVWDELRAGLGDG